MKKILLYGHGGAYNHGAEAIIQTTVAILRRRFEGEILLSTHFPDQDRQFDMDKLVDRLIPADLSLLSREKVACSLAEKEQIARQIYREALSVIDQDTICLAVGGDNYCYPNWHRQAIFHQTAKERGGKSVLWCCSIQPDMMDDRMCAVLRCHDKIYAREGSTFQALKDHNITLNIQHIPDPAFFLLPDQVSLPDGFYPGATVAVNLSPLLLRKVPEVLSRFASVVRFLLKQNQSVLLVPHVTMPMDNDVDALCALADLLTEDERRHICWASDQLNAGQLKYLISQCELLVCCRTHASIAAYSTGVPTVVVGYSIKSQGIGRDLGMEEWVIQDNAVDQLSTTVARAWEHRRGIRKHLEGILPEYLSLWQDISGF